MDPLSTLSIFLFFFPSPWCRFSHAHCHTTPSSGSFPPSTLHAQVAARKTSSPASGRRTSVVVNALSVKDLKPTGNRVLVLPDEAETKTAGGILLSAAEANTGPGSSLCGKEGGASGARRKKRENTRGREYIYVYIYICICDGFCR